MARIKTIEIGFETTVRISDYQYIKPRVVMSATLEDGDDPNEVADKLKLNVLHRLDKLEKEAFKIYKEKLK
jgi:regulator of RNase E activity RraB